MKNKTFFAVIGIAVTAIVIFGVALKISLDDSDVVGFDSPFKKEQYQIQITGMKNVYRVGERYDFSYIISGYGHECGSKKVIFPDENGDITGTYSSSSCIANVPMKDFVFDAQKEQGTTFGHISLKRAGHYIVAVEFEHSGGIEPTQKGHDFFVVENICNDVADAKRQVQCLSDSFDSCQSAYLTQNFQEPSGGTVSVVAVVESWNNCNLTVYTENSLGGHTPYNGIRSTCNEVTVKDDALLFEQCNNAEYPPIPLAMQNNKQCKDFSGNPDVQCFVDSFEQCIPATIHITRHTIEGDPIFLSGIVIAHGDGCLLDFTIDATHDRYSSQEIARRTCSDLELYEDMLTFQCDDGKFGVPLK